MDSIRDDDCYGAGKGLGRGLRSRSRTGILGKGKREGVGERVEERKTMKKESKRIWKHWLRTREP